MKWDFKKIWKESFVALVIKNLLLALVLVLVMANIVLHLIDDYTHHGEFEVVPDLRGKYTEEAEFILGAQGLHYLLIDSMYDRQKPLGTIIEQTPLANATLKRGRPVYLIINAKSIRKIPIPDLRDVSYRQAEAMLKSLDLRVDSVRYEPSEFQNLVLDVFWKGRSVEPGTRIPEGTSLVLVVGAGAGTEKMFVPDLLGLDIAQARNRILESLFVLGAVDYDVDPTEENAHEYVVYKQSPPAAQQINTGTRINISLSGDKDKLLKQDLDNNDEEEFF